MSEKGIKTRCGETMTESAWLSWVRSALRSKSLRWPPRAKAIELSRRAYKGPNKLQKWEVVCRICQKWFKLKEIVIDHYPKAAGSILSVEDIGPFANNLFCEVDNLRTLCIPCHDVHTLSEKQGISFEDAIIAKKIIASGKLKIPVQVAMLAELGYNDCSNAGKRKEAWTEIHNRKKSC